jgi:solute carrier family 5 (sodium-dependent multivitamin transporter), member 6
VNFWDWGVIFIYCAGIVGFAWWVGLHQKSQEDYYLAGKQIKWWQSGLSIMATQLGAISFVSAPAFVAMAKGGGLKWLCYEFGVPLGLIVVMMVLAPALNRNRHISIYEYLETRFDRRVRLLVSFLFQLGRGLATAVSILAGGLILSTALSIPTSIAILVVGAVTLLYDVLGGMRIVVLSDVLQMIIIVAGIVVCGGFALHLIGWSQAWHGFSPDRLKILDFSHPGTSVKGQYAFWPMVLGGMFLYASYYGCDQSQVQRQLSVGTLSGVRKSLLFNALGRFPVVLMYCLMGVVVGAIFQTPEGLQHVGQTLGMSSSSVSDVLSRAPDRMLPMFILSYLPHGIIGFLFVAILSALMSSLDSAINSLSAATIRDFYQPYFRPNADDRHLLFVAKVCTASWGIFCIAAALVFANFGESTRQTTIVLINAVGSLLYGPILAAFLLGILTKRIGAKAVTIGVIVGVLANIFVFWGLPHVSWLWWNVIGFVATVGGALVVAAVTRIESWTATDRRPLAEPSAGRWWTISAAVGVYFVLIVAFCFWLQAQVTA